LGFEALFAQELRGACWGRKTGQTEPVAALGAGIGTFAAHTGAAGIAAPGAVIAEAVIATLAGGVIVFGQGSVATFTGEAAVPVRQRDMSAVRVVRPEDLPDEHKEIKESAAAQCGLD
jgi:hypothetical protein